MIYYVTSDTDTSVLLRIATQESEVPNGRPVFAWSDTVRWRPFEVHEFDAHTEQGIDFRSVEGALYTFVLLTLDVRRVQARVVGSPRSPRQTRTRTSPR